MLNPHWISHRIWAEKSFVCIIYERVQCLPSKMNQHANMWTEIGIESWILVHLDAIKSSINISKWIFSHLFPTFLFTFVHWLSHTSSVCSHINYEIIRCLCTFSSVIWSTAVPHKHCRALSLQRLANLKSCINREQNWPREEECFIFT